MGGHYEQFYKQRARDFHRLVMAEDCDGNLLPALQAVLAVADGPGLSGLDAVDMGAGTGRLTGLLIMGGVRSVLAVEREASMQAVAKEYVAELVAQRSATCAVRHRVGDLADGVPGDPDSADLVTAGWVFGHMTRWFADQWRSHLDKFLAELTRVTRPGGYHVILETLGTGAFTPAAPDEGLAAYYQCLEREHGFVRSELSTDYQFDSVAEAAEVCGGFFGPSMAEAIRANQWARIPEWTGLWWRRN